MSLGDSIVDETIDASQDDYLPLTLGKDLHSQSSSLLPTKNTSSISYTCSHFDTIMLAKINISNNIFPARKEATTNSLDSGTNM